MKLSMWMIANRLSPILDVKPEIKSGGEKLLNSARLVYATNCVHVYQDGDFVIYEGEGDRLRLSGLSVKEAFEILQGVFDFYQDWEELIQQDIREKDFDALIEHCWIIFQNPMCIMSGNNQVLAITTGHDLGYIDPEWEYLIKYRYASLSSVTFMMHNPNLNFYRPGHQAFNFKNTNHMNHSGISQFLEFGGINCGRITLLEKTRQLNQGDVKLLEKLGELLQPVLGISTDNSSSSYNVFYDLTMGNTYNEKELELQLNYHGWTVNDNYQVVLLQPSYYENLDIMLPLLSRTIASQLSDCVVFFKDKYVVILSNRILSEQPAFENLITVVCSRSGVKAGFSMTAIGPFHADALYRQAENALKYGQLYAPKDTFYYFNRYSIYFILETPNQDDKLHACHPLIRKLWKLKVEQNDELYDTLKAYLDNEQSLSKTATAVFTHRNTVLYRIKKCLELLNDNLDNPQTRYYLRLSMHYVELSEKTGQ